MPPNTCLFSITRFLYGWQKIFTNKNSFSKHDLHVLFISFFYKMYNKKNIYPRTVPIIPNHTHILLYFDKYNIRWIMLYYYTSNHFDVTPKCRKSNLYNYVTKDARKQKIHEIWWKFVQSCNVLLLATTVRKWW